jgi:hypothetical protein
MQVGTAIRDSFFKNKKVSVLKAESWYIYYIKSPSTFTI